MFSKVIKLPLSLLSIITGTGSSTCIKILLIVFNDRTLQIYYPNDKFERRVSYLKNCACAPKFMQMRTVCGTQNAYKYRDKIWAADLWARFPTQCKS